VRGRSNPGSLVFQFNLPCSLLMDHCRPDGRWADTGSPVAVIQCGKNAITQRYELFKVVKLTSSQGGETVFGIPLFAGCIALTFIIQWLAFIPAYIFHTEKFFDLTGSITYILVTVLAVFASPKVDARSILLLRIISV